MSKIKAEDVVREDRAKMRFRFRYSAGAETDPYLVFAVREGDSPWAMFLSYPVARLYDDGTVLAVPWTFERLQDALFPTMTRVRACYGGDWHLEIRNNTPADLADVRKRWAPKPTMKGIPRAEPRRKVATQEMLAGILGKKPIPGLGEGPIRADFDNDPALQDDEESWEAG